MTEEIIVRNYCNEDLRFIKRIMSEYPSPTGRIWKDADVENMLSEALNEQPDGVLVAEANRKVVGFAIMIHREWFGISYLDYIQVSLNWISKGVGHELMKRCVDWAKRKSSRIIYTETGSDNARAIKFYEKHGFKITGVIPQYYKKELDAVILVKKLDAKVNLPGFCRDCRD